MKTEKANEQNDRRNNTQEKNRKYQNLKKNTLRKIIQRFHESEK
jgi:hypothetical protein